MHSKNAPKRLLRITPYIVTVGLGLSVAAHAAEQEPEDMQYEIPAPTIDTNGYGIMDCLDPSGNGQPDAWDTDGDGRPDLLDDDGDGKPD